MRGMTDTEKAQVALREAAAEWAAGLSAPVVDAKDTASKRRDAKLQRAAHRLSGMVKKRGYSNEFPTDQSKRVKLEIDWVPPDLARRVKAKAKREGVSLRTLILRLLRDWLCVPFVLLASPAFAQDALLPHVFTGWLSDDAHQVYPPVKTLAELTQRIDSYFLEAARFPTVGEHIELHSITDGPRLILRYAVTGDGFPARTYEAHAYQAGSGSTCAVLQMPGSGENTGVQVYLGAENDAQMRAALQESCDVYVFAKPNHDFAAIHNGTFKVSWDVIYNRLLNMGGSYSAHYLTNAIAFMRHLQNRYATTYVVGLSQGGGAALQVALQTQPTAAVIASGYSVLSRQLDPGGRDQIILPGASVGGMDLAAELGQRSTQWLFTFGQKDEWFYATDAAQQATCRALDRVRGVSCHIHAGGHEYPLERVRAFLGRP